MYAHEKVRLLFSITALFRRKVLNTVMHFFVLDCLPGITDWINQCPLVWRNGGWLLVFTCLVKYVWSIDKIVNDNDCSMTGQWSQQWLCRRCIVVSRYGYPWPMGLQSVRQVWVLSAVCAGRCGAQIFAALLLHSYPKDPSLSNKSTPSPSRGIAVTLCWWLEAISKDGTVWCCCVLLCVDNSRTALSPRGRIAALAPLDMAVLHVHWKAALRLCSVM